MHNDERWDIELVHPLDEWGKWKYLLAGNILKISGPQYEGFADLQNYNYGDSGTIYCPELYISTEQRITEIEKNEITGDITRMLLGNLRDSLARPAFMGSTISSGRSMEDKQLKAMQEELKRTKLHMFSTWGGAASFKWKDAEIYTWEEIAEYGNTDN